MAGMIKAWEGTAARIGGEALADQYFKLTRNWSLWQEPLDTAFRRITELVSSALGVARVGIWRLQNSGDGLLLIEQYDCGLDFHSHGNRLDRSCCPHYLDALWREQLIAIANIYRDPRAVEFAVDYIPVRGIGALLDTAISTAGVLYGILCIEHVGGHRHWSDDEQWFAVSVADLIAQLLAYNEMPANERYSPTLANHAPARITRVDNEGSCLHWLDAIHPDDRERVLALSRDGVQGVRELTLSRQFQTPSSQISWLASHYVTAAAADCLSLSAPVDIAARRHSESRQRELIALQRMILNEANHCLIATDTTGIIQSFNSVAEQMLGWFQQDVIAKVNLQEIVDPDEMSLYAAILSEELDQPVAPCFEALVAKPRLGISEGREWTFRRSDHSKLALRLSVSALHTGDGTVSGYLAIGTDLSDRRRAEQSARREQELILQITRGLAGTIGDQFFQSLTTALAKTLTVDVAFIAEKLPGENLMLRTIAVSERGLSGAGAVFNFTTSMALNSGGGVYYCPTGLREMFSDDTQLERLGVDCYLGAELVASDGSLLGIMGILHSGPLADVGLTDHLIRIFAVHATSELERRIQDQALRESERQCCALFDGLGDAIFTMHDDRFIDCNDMTLNRFSGKREQISSKSPPKVSPEFQPDRHHSRLDSTPFDAKVALTGVDLGGAPFLLATGRDISARKSSEHALEQSSKKLSESNRRLRWINDVSVGLHSARDIDFIASHSMEMLARLSPVTRMVFCVTDSAEDLFRVVATDGFNTDSRTAAVKTVPRAPFRAALEQDDELLVWSDPLSEQGTTADIRNALIDNHVVTLVVIRLRYDGKDYGLIILEYDTLREFDATEIDTFKAFGRTVSLAVANATHISDLEFQANHDSLTGLFNRAALHREFQRHLQHLKDGDGPALMLLDLDRFKEINDTLGHHLGDKLLCQIGARLQQGLGNRQGTLYRLGGDEFCVLVTGIDGANTAHSVARELLSELQKPFATEGLTLEISGSIGIALYPEHGMDSHELLRSADVAMYASKRGGSGALIYDRELDTHTPERLAIIAELGNAIREHQLLLHYQPKLDLASGRFIGFEALVRWQHPRLGLLSPDSFIPLAEMGESIHALTREVLAQALAQQKQWHDMGLRYSLAVNLSARNLIDDQCISYLHDLIDTYDTDPGMLELEITETALMQDPERAAELLDRMAALGVTISIDDFGTGYSSLAYLRRLPISALKIDRTFVNDMGDNQQDAVIVRSTIDLAHNLNFKVIAEGVEDQQTLELLHQMGCDQAQGYFLSRPLNADQLRQWLSYQAESGAPA